MPPDQVVAVFCDYYGPTMNAFAAAEENGRTADLENELVALFDEKSSSPRLQVSLPPADASRASTRSTSFA